MSNFWSRVLGLGDGPAGADGALRIRQVYWAQPWPLWLAVLAVLFAFVWIAFFYRRDGTRPPLWAKAVMSALRLVSLVLLLLLCFQPRLMSQRVDTTQSVVAILIDVSKSMEIKDSWVDQRRKADLIRALGGSAPAANVDRITAAVQLLNRPGVDLVNRLSRKHRVLLYTFGDEVKPIKLEPVERGGEERYPPFPELRPRPPMENATRLSGALQQAMADAAGQPLAGVLVISDGQQNVGDEPVAVAKRFGEARAPIFALGMGDPNPPKDVAITGMLVDEVVRKDDDVVVSVSFRQRGYAGQTVPVTLKRNGRVIGQQRVKLTAAAKQEHNFFWVPDAAGKALLEVSIPVQGGELSRDNNIEQAPVTVIDKKLKILLVEGMPRWEFRYLKNAILRDPSIRFSAILIDSDSNLGGEGNVPIYGFPRDKKALYEYDILILGDVPKDYFTSQNLEEIQGFVEERGGSLIVMSGENAMPWQYRGTALEKVLPVQIPPRMEEKPFLEPFQLELTEAGARNPMTFLSPEQQANVDANVKIWKELPGMYWCGIVPRAKPGATVLAVHPTITGPEGKVPLMVVQQVGEGTAFATLVDSTWEWRYRRGDKYFYRFWGQVIRSLTPHELPGANKFTRVSTDRDRYTLGEKVILRARLLTPNFHPVRAKEVKAKIRRQDGQEYPVSLEPLPGAAGVYTAEWLPPQQGTYSVTVTTAPGGQGSSAVDFAVRATSIELEAPEQNEALLRGIAGASGGRYLDYSELATLPREFRDASVSLKSRVEYDFLGDQLRFIGLPMPVAILLAFTLLITLEWLARKRAGLL
jgi:hypothetical protein